MADDFQVITKKLGSTLGAVGTIVAILAVFPLAGWVIMLMSGSRPPLWAAGVLAAIFAFGILHMVASEFATARWGMQMAFTLAAVWLMLAAAMALIAVLNIEDGGGLAALVPAVVMYWGGVSGIRLTRRAIKSLDADEGWNNDEPAKPKGFEPIIDRQK